MSKLETIDGTFDEVEEARKSALTLMKSDKIPTSFSDLFDGKNLKEVETGVRKMNEFAERCWLMSALIIYAIIYNQQMFLESGLSWDEYIKDSKNRLGLEPRDINDQLAAARFFVKYHKALVRAGWNPVGSRRKLLRADLALNLCKSADTVIDHIVHDSWRDFNLWYTLLKDPKKIEDKMHKDQPRSDIKIYSSGKITVNGIEPVTVSKALSKNDREMLNDYIRSFFAALKDGEYPALIPTYNEREAKTLMILRDRRRSEK